MVRVLTLNLCGLVGFDPPLPQRLATIGRHLEDSDVDVALFQEVWTWRTAAMLRAALPSFPHVAVRRGIGSRPAGGIATFSRLPFRRRWFRSYRGLSPLAGSLGFRLNKAINSALQGVLFVELAGSGVVIANTHLTANKDGDWADTNRYHGLHQGQLRRLHRGLRRIDRRSTVILGGDFNYASTGPLYRSLVDDGVWRDLYAGSGLTTFHLEFLPAGSRPHRIDYLLTRGEAIVVDLAPWFTEPVPMDGAGLRFVSDHVGLTVRIGPIGRPVEPA